MSQPVKFRCKECEEIVSVDETENYGTDESLCAECVEQREAEATR